LTQLKFRVYFIDKMIYSANYAPEEYEFSFDDAGELVFEVWNPEIHFLTPDGDNVRGGFEPYTKDIMQFTGMYDTDKKEIYDGDFLTNHQGDLHLVQYRNGRWHADLKKRATSKWPAQYLDCQHMEWKVVGNVYENDLQTLIDEEI